MVNEAGRPGLSVLLSVAYIIIGRLCFAQVGGVQFSFGCQSLGKAQADGVAFVPAYTCAEPSGYILPHVHYISVALRTYMHRLDGFDDLHRRSNHPARSSSRCSDTLHRFPLAIVISGQGPVAQFLACVIRLPVVFIVAPDGTVGGDAPVGIALDGFGGSVLIRDEQVHAEFGITEIDDFIGPVVLLHGVVASVPQRDTDGILVCKQGRYIVCVVE